MEQLEKSLQVKQLEAENEFLKNVVLNFANYIEHLEKIIETNVNQSLKFKKQDN